jgi:hypothetical protein
MWCSEKCYQLDAADHEDYDCYHPDVLEDDTVLEEVGYETHDPTEARQIMKEMIGEQFLIEANTRRRTRALRRQKKEARKRRKRLRQKRKRVEKEKRERRRLRRERKREKAEEKRLERARTKRDAEITRYGRKDLQPDRSVDDEEPLVPDAALEAAHIASFFLV